MGYELTDINLFFVMEDDTKYESKNEKKRKFGNLLEFNSSEIGNILKSKKNVIISNDDELKHYVIEAINNNSSNKNLYLGVIPKHVIKTIKEQITDIKKDKIDSILDSNFRYDLVINQEEIRHIMKKNISKDDIINFVNNLKNIILDFESVRYNVYNNFQHAMRFKKQIDDDNFIALEVISNQKGTFRTQTLFIYKKDYIIKKRNISPMLNDNSLSKTS